MTELLLNDCFRPEADIVLAGLSRVIEILDQASQVSLSRGRALETYL